MKRKIITVVLILFLAVSAPIPALAVFGQIPDNYTVNDNADVLSFDLRVDIHGWNRDLEEKCKGAQLVVVTEEYLEEGTYADEYAEYLFDIWGVGDYSEGNGMLLLLVTEEKKAWLTVGDGISSAFTNEMIDDYFDTYFWEYFDRGLYDLATEELLEALVAWYEDYYGVTLEESYPVGSGAQSSAVPYVPSTSGGTGQSTPGTGSAGQPSAPAANQKPQTDFNATHSGSYNNGGWIPFAFVLIMVLLALYALLKQRRSDSEASAEERVDSSFGRYIRGGSGGQYDSGDRQNQRHLTETHTADIPDDHAKTRTINVNIPNAGVSNWDAAIINDTNVKGLTVVFSNDTSRAGNVTVCINIYDTPGGGAADDHPDNEDSGTLGQAESSYKVNISAVQAFERNIIVNIPDEESIDRSATIYAPGGDSEDQSLSLVFSNDANPEQAIKVHISIDGASLSSTTLNDAVTYADSREAMPTAFGGNAEQPDEMYRRYDNGPVGMGHNGGSSRNSALFGNSGGFESRSEIGSSNRSHNVRGFGGFGGSSGGMHSGGGGFAGGGSGRGGSGGGRSGSSAAGSSGSSRSGGFGGFGAGNSSSSGRGAGGGHGGGGSGRR